MEHTGVSQKMAEMKAFVQRTGETVVLFLGNACWDLWVMVPGSAAHRQ